MQLARSLGAQCHLQPDAVRIEEIDRLAESMILRTEHIDASLLQPPLAFEKRVHCRYFEGDMVDPVGCVRVSFGRWRGRQVEERDVAAVMAFEEDVNEVNLLAIWLVSLGRHLARGIFQAKRLG